MTEPRDQPLAFWDRELWPGLLMALGLWTLCFSIMLMGPGHVVDSAGTFRYLRILGIPQRLIGAAVLADFGAIVAAVTRRGSPRRLLLSSVLLGTIIMWCVLGAAMVLGAFATPSDGHISFSGLYSAALALLLAGVAMAQIGAGR